MKTLWNIRSYALPWWALQY